MSSDLQKIAWLEPTSILDIGAHVGNWAKEAHQVWPSAQIACVEGNLSCEPFLKELGFPYYIAMLGKEKKTGLYYKQPGTDIGTGNSLYRELTPFFDGCEPVEVEVTTLADLTIFDQPDLIKIDAQGSEADIMLGGLEIIKKAKGVLLETSLAHYNDGAPLQDFIFGFMEGLGFKVRHHVSDTNRCIPPHDLIQQDYLFTRA